MSQKINIVMLAQSMAGGGAERLIINLVRWIDRRRFQVALALFNPTGPYLSDIPRDIPQIDLAGLKGLQHRRRFAAKIREVVEEFQPDVIHSHLSGASRSLLRVARHRPIPFRVVLTEQNNLTRNLAQYRYSIHRSLAAWEIRSLYRRADRIVAVSQGVLDDLTTNYAVSPRKTCVVTNCVDTENVARRAEERVELPWDNRKDFRVIIGVGRLVPQKGFSDLIRAFATASERLPCRLVILGEGEMRGELESLVRELGLGSTVWMPGFVDNPWAYIRQADVYVLSSHWEGHPLALLEALASGAAVVATRCPYGPEEIISDSHNGILVPVGDIDEIADAILRVLLHSQLRSQLEANAPARAQDFSAAAITRRYESIYDELSRR